MVYVASPIGTLPGVPLNEYDVDHRRDRGRRRAVRDRDLQSASSACAISCAKAWSGIDVQLRRRTDLVPNLVDTVKAYAAHEHGLFEEMSRRSAPRASRPTMSRCRLPPNTRLQGSLRPLVRGGGGLSGAQGQQEFPRSAAPARRDRGSAADGAALLQRHGAQPEHQHPVVSEHPCCASRSGSSEEPFFELEDRAQAAVPTVAFAERPS